jgi:hypothetical protein
MVTQSGNRVTEESFVDYLQRSFMRIGGNKIDRKVDGVGIDWSRLRSLGGESLRCQRRGVGIVASYLLLIRGWELVRRPVSLRVRNRGRRRTTECLAVIILDIGVAAMIIHYIHTFNLSFVQEKSSHSKILNL